jgi:hypothetical protein
MTAALTATTTDDSSRQRSATAVVPTAQKAAQDPARIF